MERMLLQLQKYSIQVEHKRGKDIPVSDYLSRTSLLDTYSNLIDGLDLHAHTVIQQLCVIDRHQVSESERQANANIEKD